MMIVIIVALVISAYGISTTLLPPFFPLEAKLKGATISQSGSVFGMYGLSAFVSSPFLARYGNKINPACVYITASATQSLSTLLFGVLPYIKNLMAFLSIAHILRIFIGIATAATWVSLLPILLSLFPNSASRIAAGMEFFYGVGYMLGPAVGGVLYNLGGFALPFITMGLIAMVFSVVLGLVIPNTNGPQDIQNHSIELRYMALIRTAGVMLSLLDTFFSTFSMSMVEANFQIQLMSMGITQNMINITFCIGGGGYLVGNIVSAAVADRIKYPSILAILGNMGLVAVYAFIGPSPFIQAEMSLYAIFLSIGMFAFCLALNSAPSFKRAKDSATSNGFPPNNETNHQISGLWVSISYMGYFLGATIGGVVVENCGFRYATLIWSIFHLVLFVLDLAELFYHISPIEGTKNTGYTQIY